MKKNFQKEILKKIKSGEVKMKPRWRFEIENKSILVIWMSTLAVAALSVATVFGFWIIYNPIDTLSFGEVGKQLLLDDFPYVWLFAGLLLLGGAVTTFTRIDENYKKSTNQALLITIVITVLLTILFRFLIG